MPDCNNCGGSNRQLGKACPRCGNFSEEAAQELLVHRSREAASDRKAEVKPVLADTNPKKAKEPKTK